MIKRSNVCIERKKKALLFLSMEDTIRQVLHSIQTQCKQSTISIHTDCKVTKPNIQGFVSKQDNHFKIYICQQGIYNQVLLHELIHVYDSCAKKWDFTNQEHLFCSEMRAAYHSQCADLSDATQRYECTRKHATQSVDYSLQKKQNGSGGNCSQEIIERI